MEGSRLESPGVVYRGCEFGQAIVRLPAARSCDHAFKTIDGNRPAADREQRSWKRRAGHYSASSAVDEGASKKLRVPVGSSVAGAPWCGELGNKRGRH